MRNRLLAVPIDETVVTVPDIEEKYREKQLAGERELKAAFEAERDKLKAEAKAETDALTASLGRALADGYRRAKARSVAAAGTGLNIGNVIRQRRLELAAGEEKAGAFAEKIAQRQEKAAGDTERLKEKYEKQLQSLAEDLEKAKKAEKEDLYNHPEKYFTAPGSIVRIY